MIKRATLAFNGATRRRRDKRERDNPMEGTVNEKAI